MKKAIFLDRDGVLNAAIIKEGLAYAPETLDAVIIPEDAYTALSALKKAGFLLIGATNQPDVARGTRLKKTVEEINQYLISKLPLDSIKVCYHDNPDFCLCRKPLPGLLVQSAEEMHIDLSKSFMIGDRWRDIDAGRNAGCKTIWLKCDYKEQQPVSPDYIATSLTEASAWILQFNY